MQFWILFAIGIYFVQTLLAPISRWCFGDGLQLMKALGPRDNPPSMPKIGSRLQRACHNMTEAMFIFIPLALLSEIKDLDNTLGASIFVIARILYVPAYVTGLPGLRSLVWMVGHLGLVLMLLSLIH